MRSLAREVVFKELFAKLFNPDDEEFFAVLLKDDKLTESDKVFANELLTIINQNKDKYLSDIERLSVGYKLARIYNADKCAMLIGMAELENMKEECLICKAPLEYLEQDVLMECEICHKKENSKTRCVNGHYVCNDCHTQGL